MQSFMIIGRRIGDQLDRFSDSLTTFRYLLYILLFYLAAACVLAIGGKFTFSVASILGSAAVLVASCKLANMALSKVFSIPINHESDIITGLILAFVLTPAHDLNGFVVLAAAGGVAMASKYILTLRGRHIFNPAAIGAFTSGLVFHHYASWWVGGQAMAPILAIGGILILRKMRRFESFFSFTAVYVLYLWLAAPLLFSTSTPTLHHIYVAIVSTPLLFFGTIMLTEPLTSPTKRDNLLIFSIFVGILYSATKLRRPPEEALLIGNALAFLLEPNRSLLLKLVGKRQEAAGIYSFIFSAPSRLKFKAGQYMEWTLPHTGLDSRGNRRYLTIASAPSEQNLMFTIKIPSSHSKFKETLLQLRPGQKIAAQRLAGTFTLPSDDKKLVFIAGGVGITPFRSMVKAMVDSKERYDATLFYSVKMAEEIAFRSLFKEAESTGLNTKYVVTDGNQPHFLHGYIDKKLIKQNLPDYKERLFYVSGPQAFVAAVRLALTELRVDQAKIKTDFFPGYN